MWQNLLSAIALGFLIAYTQLRNEHLIEAAIICLILSFVIPLAYGFIR